MPHFFLVDRNGNLLCIISPLYFRGASVSSLAGSVSVAIYWGTAATNRAHSGLNSRSARTMVLLQYFSSST